MATKSGSLAVQDASSGVVKKTSPRYVSASHIIFAAGWIMYFASSMKYDFDNSSARYPPDSDFAENYKVRAIGGLIAMVVMAAEVQLSIIYYFTSKSVPELVQRVSGFAFFLPLFAALIMRLVSSAALLSERIDFLPPGTPDDAIKRLRSGSVSALMFDLGPVVYYLADIIMRYFFLDHDGVLGYRQWQYRPIVAQSLSMLVTTSCFLRFYYISEMTESDQVWLLYSQNLMAGFLLVVAAVYRIKQTSLPASGSLFARAGGSILAIVVFAFAVAGFFCAFAWTKAREDLDFVKMTHNPAHWLIASPIAGDIWWQFWMNSAYYLANFIPTCVALCYFGSPRVDAGSSDLNYGLLQN